MDNLKLNIVYRKCEDGGFIAECLEIPGCMSQGDTFEEARANIMGAVEGCLFVMMEDAMNSASRQSSRNVAPVYSRETIPVVPPHCCICIDSVAGNGAEFCCWDEEMVRDFSPGGRGMGLLAELEREIAEAGTSSLEEGLAARRW